MAFLLCSHFYIRVLSLMKSNMQWDEQIGGYLGISRWGGTTHQAWSQITANLDCSGLEIVDDADEDEDPNPDDDTLEIAWT